MTKRAIIRLTEQDLHRMIRESVRKILREDVLGNDWREREEDENVMNNYEPFEAQEDELNAQKEFDDQYDWSTAGEEYDPTIYGDGDYEDVQDLSDGDLYRNGGWG